jgi:hypothetical protein
MSAHKRTGKVYAATLCNQSCGVDRTIQYICRYLHVAAERDERPIASTASGKGNMVMNDRAPLGRGERGTKKANFG